MKKLTKIVIIGFLSLAFSFLGSSLALADKVNFDFKSFSFWSGPVNPEAIESIAFIDGDMKKIIITPIVTRINDGRIYKGYTYCVEGYSTGEMIAQGTVLGEEPTVVTYVIHNVVKDASGTIIEIGDMIRAGHIRSAKGIFEDAPKPPEPPEPPEIITETVLRTNSVTTLTLTGYFKSIKAIPGKNIVINGKAYPYEIEVGMKIVVNGKKYIVPEKGLVIGKSSSKTSSKSSVKKTNTESERVSVVAKEDKETSQTAETTEVIKESQKKNKEEIADKKALEKIKAQTGENGENKGKRLSFLGQLKKILAMIINYLKEVF